MPTLSTQRTKVMRYLLGGITALLFSTQLVLSQTVILNDPGKTYTNTDGPTLDIYGPVDVTNCTSLRFELSYNFSLPWQGGGNMESADECNFGGMPCAGDPNNPLAGDCSQCWDFLWVRFMVNGVEIGGDLIGEAGTTDAEQSGFIDLEHCTMGSAATAQIQVSTQTWAANESVTFSSLMIICYEAVPDVIANPNPICEDELLNLTGNVSDPGAVNSSMWTGPGTIDDPGSLSTTVTDIPPGPAIYTLTVTDGLNCTASDQVTVTVHPTPTANMAGPLEMCDDGSGQATFDLTQLDLTISSGMGNVLWYNDAGLSSLIGNPMAFMTSGATVYAVVDNGFCQSDVIEIELIVIPSPEAFPSILEKCEDIPGSGIATFNLSDLDDEINGGSGLTVNYYSDPSGNTPIFSPFTTSSTTIFARVSDGICESELVLVQLIVLPGPSGNEVRLTVCEDAPGLGTALIDLRSLRDSIVISGNPALSFYQDPAFSIPAMDPFPAMIGVTSLYAQLDNGLCVSSPILIEITVLEKPGIRNARLEVCEDPVGSGIGFFQLDSLHGQLIGGQTGLTITWMSDTLGNPFPNPYIGGDTTLYAIASNGFCESDLVEVELIVISKPDAQSVTDTACADQSGTAFFDLSEYDILIASDTSREEVFYASDTNFLNNVNTNFRTGDTVIYARVLRGDCYSDFVEVRLFVTSGPILSGLNDAIACDSFILPVIPGINLTPNASFYLQRNGQGRAWRPGETIRSSGTIYVYDRIKECLDQDSFELEIVSSPHAGDSVGVSVCDGAILDLTTVINGDTGGSFEDIDGSGSLTDSLFNTTGFDGQTFSFRYVLPTRDPCDGDSSIVTVMVQRELDAGTDNSIQLCQGDSIELTSLLIGADLGGSFMQMNGTLAIINNNFLSSLSGTGTFDVLYSIGDGVVCPTDEATLTIEVLPGISLDPIADTTVCDLLVLPAITGINSQFASYFLDPNKNSGPFFEGDTIFSTTTLYIFGESPGFCSDTASAQVTVNRSSTFNIVATLCPDSTIQVGTEIFDENNRSGMVILKNANVAGCDSVVNIDLDFYPEATFNLTRQLCFGQSVVVNGTTYDSNNPTGSEILKNGSVNGCDSTVIIELTYTDYARGSFDQKICTDDTLTINGQQYHAGRTQGLDTLFGMGKGGCDSIVSINLTVSEPVLQIDSVLCEHDALVVNGTVYDIDNTNGTETIQNGSHLGCDSIIMIDLRFEQNTIHLIQRTLCFGDSLVINGRIYDEQNPQGSDTLFGRNQFGCDSIVNIELDFQSTSNELISFEICPNDTVEINGKEYHAQKTNGSDTLFGGSITNCDSVIIVDLLVLEDVESEYTDTLCPGESIVINGTTYDQARPSGIERFPGLATNGCDSLVFIDLTFESDDIRPSLTSYQIDLGDSIRLGFLTTFGYDSINWSPSTGLSCVDCPSPWASPTVNTIYTVTLFNENGCSLTQDLDVQVNLDTDIYIPNSFSPNGDGLNDRFRIFVKNSKVERINELTVFNRWGELVYQELNTNPDDGSHTGWDGTFNGEQLNPAVFVYTIEINLLSGNKVRRSGNVTLIE